jgi:hypothetical protein
VPLRAAAVLWRVRVWWVRVWWTRAWWCEGAARSDEVSPRGEGPEYAAGGVALGVVDCAQTGAEMAIAATIATLLNRGIMTFHPSSLLQSAEGP